MFFIHFSNFPSLRSSQPKNKNSDKKKIKKYKNKKNAKKQTITISLKELTKAAVSFVIEKRSKT